MHYDADSVSTTSSTSSTSSSANSTLNASTMNLSQAELEARLSDEALHELAMRHLLKDCVEINVLDGLIHAKDTAAHVGRLDSSKDPIALFITSKLNDTAMCQRNKDLDTTAVESTRPVSSFNRLTSLFDRFAVSTSGGGRSLAIQQDEAATKNRDRLRELSLERQSAAYRRLPSPTVIR